MNPFENNRPPPEHSHLAGSAEPNQQGMTVAEHAVNLVVVILLVALGLYFLLVPA